MVKHTQTTLLFTTLLYNQMENLFVSIWNIWRLRMSCKLLALGTFTLQLSRISCCLGITRRVAVWFTVVIEIEMSDDSH